MNCKKYFFIFKKNHTFAIANNVDTDVSIITKNH